MDPYVVTKLRVNYGSKDYSTRDIIQLTDLLDVSAFSNIELNDLTLTLTAAPAFVDQAFLLVLETDIQALTMLIMSC